MGSGRIHKKLEIHDFEWIYTYFLVLSIASTQPSYNNPSSNHFYRLSRQIKPHSFDWNTLDFNHKHCSKSGYLSHIQMKIIGIIINEFNQSILISITYFPMVEIAKICISRCVLYPEKAVRESLPGRMLISLFLSLSRFATISLNRFSRCRFRLLRQCWEKRREERGRGRRRCE